MLFSLQGVRRLTKTFCGLWKSNPGMRAHLHTFTKPLIHTYLKTSLGMSKVFLKEKKKLLLFGLVAWRLICCVCAQTFQHFHGERLTLSSSV